MRCCRYGNGDRMHVILNGEPLEEGGSERDVVHILQPIEDVKGMWYTE